jgi:hypothetical protein
MGGNGGMDESKRALFEVTTYSGDIHRPPVTVSPSDSTSKQVSQS